MIIKDNKKINPIISDREAKNTKVRLQTTDGKDFGEVSASAYSAIRGDYLDKYSPVDNNEKSVLDKYRQYMTSQYPQMIPELNTKLNPNAKALQETIKQQKDSKKDGFMPWLGKQAMAGIAQFNKGVTSTVDFLLPTEFLGRYDFISKINDYYSKSSDSFGESAHYSSLSRGKGWKTAGDLVSGTLAAAPNAILAVLSAGTSLSASGATTLAKGAATTGSTLSALKSVSKTMLKNPSYWSSVMQTLGTDYEEAKERGANDVVAVATAVITTALNAGIEVGGGIEQLPQNLKKGGRNAVYNWAKSSFEEGREEVLQSITANTMAKLLYDNKAPVFSMSNDNAIINPKKLATDFGMGTAIGGILGAGQSAAVKGVNVAEYAKIGKYYKDAVQSIVDTGLESPENSVSYELAKKAQQKLNKSGKLSYYDIGKLFQANVEQIAQEEKAAENTQPTDDNTYYSENTHGRTQAETEQNSGFDDNSIQKNENIVDNVKADTTSEIARNVAENATEQTDETKTDTTVLTEDENKVNSEIDENPTSVSVGDTFLDNKTGNVITITERDAENTTVEIDTGTKTETREFSNSQADNLVTSEQFEQVENSETLSPEEAQKYNIVVSNLKRKADELGLLDSKFFTALQNVNLYNPTASDRALISSEFRRVFAGNTDTLVTDWLNAINVDAQPVTSINEQNMPVSTENTPINEDVTDIDADLAEGEILSLKHAKNIYALFKDSDRIIIGKDIISDGYGAIPLTDKTLAEVKKIAKSTITENPNMSLGKFYRKDNDIVIQGDPKTDEITVKGKAVGAYVFKLGNAFYTCQQKYIDVFNNGKNVITANRQVNIPWTVHNENGDFVALFLGARLEMDDERFNSLRSVAEIKSADKQKKAENASKPFNQNEVRQLIKGDSVPFSFSAKGNNYISEGHIFIKCDGAALDFIKNEYRKYNSNSNYEIEHRDSFGANVEKVLAGTEIAETANPILYNGNNALDKSETAYVVGDYAIAFNKNYVNLIKKRSSTMRIVSQGTFGTTLLVGYDADINVTGFALPIIKNGKITTEDGRTVPFVTETDIERLVEETAANETKSDKSVIETPESVTEPTESVIKNADSVMETPENEKITVDMDDETRAELLNKKSVNVVSVDAENTKAIDNIDLDALQNSYPSYARPIIKKIARDFGIVNDPFFNPDIELEFSYSGASIQESINKQHSRYGDFVKMLSVFSDVIENAVGVETHKDKYTGTRREDTNLKQMYVLASAFSDEKGVYPVKLEVKEFKKNTNKLYLSVVLTKKESRYLSGNLGQNQLNTTPPTSTISISDLVGIVNPSEGDFLKYFPDSMLDSEQIEGKNKALAKDAEKIEKLSEDKKRSLATAENADALSSTPETTGSTASDNSISHDTLSDYEKAETDEQGLNNEPESDIISVKEDFEVGDVININGKQWRVTSTDFTMTFENLDKNDSEATFQHIGGMDSFKNTHDYTVIKEIAENVHEGLLGGKSDNDNGIRESEPVSETEKERNTGTEDRELGKDVSGEDGAHIQTSETKAPAAGQLDTGDNDNGIREPDDGNGDSGTRTDGNDNVNVTDAKDVKSKDFVIAKAVAESLDTSPPSMDDNIAAIEMLHALESSGKAPTKAQQNILAKFKGWGGLANSFYGNARLKLQRLLSADELKAAQSTVNDAYFTPTDIIDGIYKALSHIGFEGGNILEPSMGVGNFFGRMPKSIKNGSKLFGVEIDTVSGRIAQYLYPSANIEIAPFQDVAFKDGAFDLIIGNVPFGEVKYKYKGKKYLIHDYFFVKAMDKLNEGGIMAFLTTKGTLDKLDSTARNELNNKGRLIAAYRLPSNVFSRSAGANVVTDLIIMQKSDVKGESFVNLGSVEVDGKSFSINEYFERHPENIIGELTARRDWRSGKTETDVTAKGNTAEQLAKAIKNLPKNLLSGVQTVGNVDVTENATEIQTFTVTEKGDVEYIDAATGDVKQIKGKRAKTAADYIGVKKAYQDLVDTTLSGDEAQVIEGKRKALNKEYDAFVKNHGTLEDNKKILSADNGFYKISGLEVYDTKTKQVTKSEMFTKDTLGKRKPKKADNVLDALSISIGETGGVDINRIAGLTGLSESEAVKQLEDRIVYTPEGTYELNEVYLSGNVREKYAAVKDKKGFEKNAEMLKAVIPEDVPAKNITPQFGAPWIKPDYVAEFLKDTFRLYNKPAVNYDTATGTWAISGNTWGDHTLMTSKYGTKYIDALKLSEKALNMRTIVVKDNKGKVIVSETKAAQQKADDIRSAFEEWCFKDADRRKDLVTTFNEKFNSNRNMDFSELAKYLTFDGLSDTFKLRDYQKRAVARAVFNGNTLLAHGVGTGKTAEMISIAMELKRMGMAKKNMMVVPNHKVADFRNDILKMYPSAKVAYLEKGANATQRQKFYALVASNDFDIVIIPHSSFGMLDVSADTKKAFINNQIAELEEVLTEAQSEKGSIDGRFIKSLENQKKRLAEKLKFITESAKDNGNTFEELGVDSLFVDEAHNFKNLPFFSKLSRVAGVSINQSNNKTRASRAENMFMITDYLNRNNGRITFGTATPITNSMSEIYNMMRFLRPDILEDAGLKSFDAWASMFGSIVNQAEVDPSGRNMRMKERFAKFKNVSQMIEQFRRMADILKTGDVIQELPEVTREDVITPPNDIQEEFLDIIDKMIDDIRRNGQTAAHNMLEVTTAGQMAAVDLRFVVSYFDGKYTVDDLNLPNNRTTQVATRVYDEYVKSNSAKGTQFVFCDVGVREDPTKKYNFYVYGDLINKLVALGIPREEIAIAQDFEDKADLSAKVNTGEIRVLIGSTAVMGEGMNAQNKAVALHHMTVPARPSDIEQREGRIIRYGNENKNVRIYRYIQEKSYDSYQWQMQERKAGFINQALSGGTVEELEEMSDFQLSAREAKAIASGNPLLLEKIEVEDKLNNLKMLRNKFNTEKLEMRDRLAALPNQIAQKERFIAATTADMKTVADNTAKDFEITLGSTKYTERAKAAEALQKGLEKVPRNGVSHKIGSYRGLDLYYSSSFDKGTHFILKGQGEYSTLGGDSAAGNITRILNLADKIGESVNIDKALVENYKTEIETLKKEVNSEFQKAQELDELQARLNDIDTKLGINVSAVDMSDVIVDDDADADGTGEVYSSRDLPQREDRKNIPKHKKSESAISVTTDNIPVKFNTINEARKAFVEYAQEHFPKSVINVNTGAEIGISRRGIDKFLSGNISLQKYATGFEIPSLIESAVKVGEAENKKGKTGINGYEYYDNSILINGKEFGAHIRVKNTDMGDKYYGHTISQSVEEIKIEPLAWNSDEKSGHPINASSSNNEILTQNNSVVNNNSAQETKNYILTPQSDNNTYSSKNLTPYSENKWVTERIKGNKTDNVNLAKIIQDIRKEFGIPISTGKVTDPDASGIYKEQPEVIRTRIADNLPTIAHELGHHLDKQYKLSALPSISKLRESVSKEFLDQYPDDRKSSEAVGEFVRVYLKNMNEANELCQDFYSDFISTLSKEELKALNEIALSVNAYMSYNISERYDAAIISSKEYAKRNTSPTDKIKEIRQKWVDPYLYLKETVDYVEKVKGGSLSGKNDAYRLATNALCSHSVSNFLLVGGMRDLSGNIINGGKSFIECIADVKSDDMKVLDKYLVLRHSLEWIAPEQDDVSVKRVFADDTLENAEEIKKQIAELEKAHPEFKTAAENLYEYQNNILKYFVIPSGGMTEETLSTLNRKYPSYVPFYRAIGKDKSLHGKAKSTFVNQRSPIMRAKGSGEMIISPLESIIKNTEKMVNFSLRNQVADTLGRYADTVDGFGQFMEKVAPDMIPHSINISNLKETFTDALQQVVNSGDDYFAVSNLFDELLGDTVTDFTPVANANKRIVTVMRNGRPTYYQIHDEALYKSVAELTPKQLKGFEAVDLVMNWMKVVITQNNPIFAASNAIRDFHTAYKLSEINNPASFAAQYVKALSGIIANSDAYKQYKAMGGGHSSELSASIEKISKTLRKVAEKDAGIAKRLAHAIFRHPIETIAALNDAVESIPRFMEFQRTLNAGGDLQEAIYNANDITTNFRRQGAGATAKAVNKFVLFNNAAIQGLDKTIRTLTSKDAKKRNSALLKFALVAIIGGLIRHFWNKEVDEEGYKNLSSYKKNNFYNYAIGDGMFISLPKERENAILDSFIERALESLMGNDEAFYDFGGYLTQQLLPPMFPDDFSSDSDHSLIENVFHSFIGSAVFGGLADIGFNTDFKGSPIESDYDKDLPSFERYNDNTSWVAHKLGQTKIARGMDMSPKKIDHLLSSYTGIIGQINKALFPMNGSRRDLSVGLRNKFISDSNYSTDVLNRMYENEEKAKNAYLYKQTIDSAVEYEQNAIITSYISAMNKAIRALPESQQRTGRAYLLKSLNRWDYNNTAAQDKMISRLGSETFSDDVIVDTLPSSTIEWTKNKVKYSYQMTPQEYDEYAKDYLEMVNKYRNYQDKHNSDSSKYAEALSSTSSEVKKVLNKKYKQKYLNKAQKIKSE